MANFGDLFLRQCMKRPSDETHLHNVFLSTLKAFRPKWQLPDAEDIDGMSPNDIMKLIMTLNSDSIPTLSSISFSEVKCIAVGRSQQIFEDWYKLNDILGRHEALLVSRWINKPRDKRKKILQMAWSDMSTSHCPDFQA